MKTTDQAECEPGAIGELLSAITPLRGQREVFKWQKTVRILAHDEAIHKNSFDLSGRHSVGAPSSKKRLKYREGAPTEGRPDKFSLLACIGADYVLALRVTRTDQGILEEESAAVQAEGIVVDLVVV